MTADAPERIWITPCHRCQGPDDYYLLHPDYRNGKGTEYLRADLAIPTPAQAAKVLLAAGPLPTMAVEAAHNEIDWCRDNQNTRVSDHPSQRPGTSCAEDIQDAWRAALRAITLSEKDT